MKIEIRADGAHISGYVNATEKKSNPVITPHGKVIEVIEPRAFEQALERAENIPMTKDHNSEIVVAETRAGNLSLHEDNIGLHYEAIITDEQTIQEARAGKIKGLSFGMFNVVDDLQQRADDLPLRHIKALDLDHITLVVNKSPVYSATSVEVRADETIDIEERANEQKITIKIEKEKTKFDNSQYRERLNSLTKSTM